MAFCDGFLYKVKDKCLGEGGDFLDTHGEQLYQRIAYKDIQIVHISVALDLNATNLSSVHVIDSACAPAISLSPSLSLPGIICHPIFHFVLELTFLACLHTNLSFYPLHYPPSYTQIPSKACPSTKSHNLYLHCPYLTRIVSLQQCPSTLTNPPTSHSLHKPNTPPHQPSLPPPPSPIIMKARRPHIHKTRMHDLPRRPRLLPHLLPKLLQRLRAMDVGLFGAFETDLLQPGVGQMLDAKLVAEDDRGAVVGGGVLRVGFGVVVGFWLCWRGALG